MSFGRLQVSHLLPLRQLGLLICSQRSAIASGRAWEKASGTVEETERARSWATWASQISWPRTLVCSLTSALVS